MLPLLPAPVFAVRDPILGQLSPVCTPLAAGTRVWPVPGFLTLAASLWAVAVAGGGELGEG